MKRVAIIGLGKMGILHASLLSTLPDVNLVALCEKKSLICRFSRKVFKGIRLVGEVSELADFALDAVYVATPPSAHFPIIRTIYSEGITANVFVEKPLASHPADSEEMCSLASSGGINMVGYNRRFAVTFKKAKETLDESTLGEMVDFEGYAYSSDLLGVKSESKALSVSGVLKDLGCHAIDLANWFFGGLHVGKAEVTSTAGGSGDSVHLEVKTSGGLSGKLNSSWCMENYRLPEIGLIINGSKGTMKVNDDKVELKLNSGKSYIWHRQDLDDNVGFFIGRSDYFREDRAFMEAVASGSNIEPNFRTSAEVDRIIGQVEEKTRENDR